MIDIDEMKTFLDKSRIIGKQLTTSSPDIGYSVAYISIIGYPIASETTALKMATQICIGKVAAKKEIERRTKEDCEPLSSTKSSIKSSAISGVSCTHVELYLTGEISSSALLKLSIENCNV